MLPANTKQSSGHTDIPFKALLLTTTAKSQTHDDRKQSSVGMTRMPNVFNIGCHIQTRYPKQSFNTEIIQTPVKEPNAEPPASMTQTTSRRTTSLWVPLFATRRLHRSPLSWPRPAPPRRLRGAPAPGPPESVHRGRVDFCGMPAFWKGCESHAPSEEHDTKFVQSTYHVHPCTSTRFCASTWHEKGGFYHIVRVAFSCW